MASRLPTSSSYWTLRAEQVMDRVFEQQDSDLVPVDVAVQDVPVTSPAAPSETSPSPRQSDARPWLVPALSGVAVAGVVSSLWLANHWTITRNQLDLERNLLLVERLREADVKADPPQPAQASDAALNPPPLEQEPDWVTALEPLTVPVQPVLQGAPPPPAIDEVLPLLTGVVQGPGGTSSAIFQLNNASISSGIGDAIGSSGWTLSSVSESGAVIQRNGQRRNLSVGGLF
ncbi:MAG: pilus assembly protein PilZ [Synechococcus sp.]